MAGRLLAPVAVVLLLVGCVSETPPAQPVGGDETATPVLEAPLFREPVLVGPAGFGAEPSLVVTREGHVYVATPPHLWRSVDGGRSFEALGQETCGVRLPAGACPPGQARRDPGLDGPGDGDLAADARGILYWAGLKGKSGALPFQVSRDGGETWSEPVDLAAGNDTDREWIDALPDGTLYVTWRDFGSPDEDDPPERLRVRRSPDGGATWEPARDAGEDALQGPIAHDPSSGALYFATYQDGLRVARSRDQGSTWTYADVSRDEREDGIGYGNPTYIHLPLAVDEAGAVYAVWSADEEGAAPASAKGVSTPRVWFSASTDGGERWTEPKALSPEGRSAIFPWIAAGKAGRVAVAWYENRNGLPNEDAPDLWDVVLVESVTASAAEPVFVGGRANAEPVHLGPICTNGGGCDTRCFDDACVPTRVCGVLGYDVGCVGRDRSRLDFFELALMPDGQPVVAWASDADPPTSGTGVRVFFGGVERGTPIG